MSDGAAEDPASDLPGNVTTVGELNADINRVIKQAQRNDLEFDFIIGDVSNDSEANGTRYFQLVDDDAGIQCLAFSRTREKLPEFEEGDRIAVKGKLNYYEKRGNCSLYVNGVVLIGDSHYHRQIEKVRETLSEEGLFDDDRKQPLPRFPTGIGIVTSEGSDAEKDAINAIRDRHPDVNIYLHHSNVQGLGALQDICTGITALDAYSPVDVIVVTRGGGSEQDLHAFNTEGVARTIEAADTPIVTAIGHENDHPIVDDVADDRAMTPTEIGSVVVPAKQNLIDQVTTSQNRLSTAYSQLVTRTVESAQRALDTAYNQHSTSRIGELRAVTDTAYEQHAASEVTSLRNDVNSTFQSFKQQKEHETETAELEAKQERYKKAVIALTIALIIALFLVMLFVL